MPDIATLAKLGTNPVVQNLIKEAITGNIDPNTVSAVVSELASSKSPAVQGLVPGAGTSAVPGAIPGAIAPAPSNNGAIIVGFIIFILIAWSISIIYCNFVIKDKDTKDNIRYTNSVLFGSIGILPLIGILIGVIIISSSIPTFDQLIAKALKKLS